jgi:long-chain acyl-CoA synthetase
MQKISGKPIYPIRPIVTLRDMLEQSVARYGSRPAFTYREMPGGPVFSRTYTELSEDSRNLGTALLALGLGGRRLAIIGENSYRWCLAHLTVINGVGTAVPLDHLLPEDEMRSLLGRSQADAIFYDYTDQEAVLKAASLLPNLRTLICLRPERLKDNDRDAVNWATPARDSQNRREPDAPPAMYRLPDLLAFGGDQVALGDLAWQQVKIDPEALMAVIFTSGTTSTAKGVMLCHRNICADICGLAGMIDLKPGTRMLSVLPLHHTFENTCGLYMALYVGAEIHECDGLRYIQKNLQEYGIDMLIGVPLLFSNFYNKVQDTLKKTGKLKLVNRMIPVTQFLRRLGIDLRRTVYRQILAAFGGRLSLGICGAAPIDPAIIRFFDAVGFTILQGYGLTETSPVVSGCNIRLFRPGTVGLPLTGVEVAIDGDVAGQPGEILVRGGIVMKGYFGDEAATWAAIGPDGWFHTGDVGRIDPKNGFLTITGRVKSMIVLQNGKKVFPEELEYLIEKSGFVKESLVWGDPDGAGDVVISAKLVVDKDAFQEKTGHPADEGTIGKQLERLIRDINASLPTFMSIRQYVFSFQEMVKTTTLKVRRTIEIDRIGAIMKQYQLKWRELTGSNVDRLGNGTPPTTDSRPLPASGRE